MKALHDISSAPYLRFSDLRTAFSLPRYQQDWYDRYIGRRALRGPREVFFYDYYEPQRWLNEDWEPAAEMPRPRSSREVVSRLDEDVARLEQLNLPGRYALVVSRSELRALTAAGVLYEGAQLEYRGYRIALTG